jgi:hypothetical protein
MRAGSTALLTVLMAALSTAQPKPPRNLVIAQQGYLFAGGTYSDGKNGRIMSGQLYAEFQIPARRAHPWPIVMNHRGGQTGTNFTGTPNGREGWAEFFLRDGYAVYVVDQGTWPRSISSGTLRVAEYSKFGNDLAPLRCARALRSLAASPPAYSMAGRKQTRRPDFRSVLRFAGSLFGRFPPSTGPQSRRDLGLTR